MDVKEIKPNNKRMPGEGSVSAWIAAREPAFTEADLTDALDDQLRGSGTVSLSVRDRSFWDANSGVTAENEGAAAAAAAANVVSVLVSDASALTAEEVGQQLNLSSSTIRHYKTAGRLYSYERQGKLNFPAWQFSVSTGRAIPSLAAVLAVLPRDAHPQTIAGFFQTPQPDLVIDGQATSAKQWLESGGDAEPVVSIANDVSSGF
ncbi:hypothetical protein [Arthrobacter sp. H35-D1]|uniref:hypothetical protein n=1 Tax=Arthrobacter sp. H35-D1 TaxID=3046202 RepID=UPI0024BBE4E6|nr:hypothetical protein [Arthrobacter sp. H35-D1]MDJ0312691.1 hypothetical protein [Arthrobacter sp. H35-D1]